MDLILDSEKETITFNGKFVVSELRSLTDLLKDYLQVIESWDTIYLNLRNIEEADSSFVQLIFSFLKTFPKKIKIKATSPKVFELLKLHGFKTAEKKSEK